MQDTESTQLVPGRASQLTELGWDTQSGCCVCMLDNIKALQLGKMTSGLPSTIITIVMMKWSSTTCTPSPTLPSDPAQNKRVADPTPELMAYGVQECIRGVTSAARISKVSWLASGQAIQVWTKVA